MSLAIKVTMAIADFVIDTEGSSSALLITICMCVNFCVCYLSREGGSVARPCHLAWVELSGDLS